MSKKDKKHIVWDRLDVFTRLSSGQTMQEVAREYGTTQQAVALFCKRSGIRNAWVLDKEPQK